MCPPSRLSTPPICHAHSAYHITSYIFPVASTLAHQPSIKTSERDPFRSRLGNKKKLYATASRLNFRINTLQHDQLPKSKRRPIHSSAPCYSKQYLIRPRTCITRPFTMPTRGSATKTPAAEPHPYLSSGRLSSIESWNKSTTSGGQGKQISPNDPNVKAYLEHKNSMMKKAK